MSSYDIMSYLVKLRTTECTVLLVEGDTDKRALQWLIEKSVGAEIWERIQIDSAEIIRAPTGPRMGNREKVEEICRKAALKPELREKVLGFVDREFRSFDIDEGIQDTLRSHHVDSGVVWSRGHSMENYCFEPEVFVQPFEICAPTDCYKAAYSLFRQYFEASLRLAAAVSLSGKELGKLKPLANSIDWTCLEPGEEGLKVNIDVWRKVLTHNKKFTEDVANKVIERYSYWSSIVQESDQVVIRWFCHGHTGFAVLWSTFIYCVHLASGGDRKAVVKVMEQPETQRLSLCFYSWAKTNITNGKELCSVLLRELNMDRVRTAST